MKDKTTKARKNIKSTNSNTPDTTNTTLQIFYQEFKDSQGYLKETLEEIKKQVKYTNGRVTDLEIKTAILDKGYDSLIKENERAFSHGHSNRTFWISVISISIAILTFILKLLDAI